MSLIAARVVTRNTSDGRMVCVRVGEGSTVHPYVEPPKGTGTSSLLSRLPDVDKRGTASEKKKKKPKRGKVSIGRVLPNPVVVPKQGSEDELSSADGDVLDDLEPTDDHFHSGYGPVRVLQVCGEDMAFQVLNGQVHWTMPVFFCLF